MLSLICTFWLLMPAWIIEWVHNILKWHLPFLNLVQFWCHTSRLAFILGLKNNRSAIFVKNPPDLRWFCCETGPGGLEPSWISKWNQPKYSISNTKVDLKLSAENFFTLISTAGGEVMTNCGYKKIKVATTESLGNKRKRRSILTSSRLRLPEVGYYLNHLS